MASLLTMNGIGKRLDSFTFGPFDFQAEEGTVVALVGPNGSGKSTFFRLLTQLIQPEQGDIHLFGKSLKEHEIEIKRWIGFAGGGLLSGYGHLSVRGLAGLISHWYPSWNQERYEMLLRRYEIPEWVHYNKSSTGTQKKIEFILALSHHPRLLLLDEVTAGIDLLSQRKINEDLTQYMEDGRNSIIMATHIMDDIKRMCDIICVLHQGKIIDQFDKDEASLRWARLWLAEPLPSALQLLPTVVSISYETSPPQIVTSNAEVLEPLLASKGIEIEHRQRLELDEIIAHVIG